MGEITMLLGTLFPKWRAASTSARVPWDLEFDPAGSDGFGGLLALIASDQSEAMARDRGEFERVCEAIVEDILALRADPAIAADPLNLLYLQFEACLAPLRIALNRGALGDTYDWIINGLGDEVGQDVIRQISTNRIGLFAATATNWIAWNRKSTIADWAGAFYYLSRRSATLQQAGTIMLAPTLAVLATMPATDRQAIEARCMILGWVQQYADEVTPRVSAELEAAFDDENVGANVRTILAVSFAASRPGVTARLPRDWALWALRHGSVHLGSHEPFQLIWHLIETADDWDRNRNAALDAATHYAVSLRGLRSPTAIAQATDQRSALLEPALMKMTAFERGDDLLAILQRWYDVPEVAALPGGILFVLPGHPAGIGYLGARSQIIPIDPHPLATTIAATNEALGLSITVRGEERDHHEVDAARRLAQPDYALGQRFEAALRQAYRFNEVKAEVMEGRTALVAFPGQPHPIQALMAAERGFSLPISSSLELPREDRAPRRALIWAAGNDYYSGFEAHALQRRFEAAGIACERRTGADARPDDFMQAYGDPDFDILWVAGHAQVDHWRDGSAELMAGENCLVGIDQMVRATPRDDWRRLLVLNVCDGGAAAINGGIHRLGLAPMLANRAQATISHLWPVLPLPAAAFGVFLADGLALGLGYHAAYERALEMIRTTWPQARDAVRGIVPGAELNDRLAATDLDIGNILHWGSAAFFQ